MTAKETTMLGEVKADIGKLIGVVVGANGGGLVKQVERNGEKIDVLEDLAVRKEDCAVIRNGAVDHKRNRWLVTKDIIIIIVAIGSLAIAFLAAA